MAARMFCAAVLCVLCGCANQSGARMGLFSATAPVIAMLADDLFVGEAKAYLDQKGKISVRSKVNAEIQCIGQFVHTTSAGGTGRMQCNDGALATFEFQSLGRLSGYGFGTSARGPVIFTYGLTLEEAKKYLTLPVGKSLMKEGNEVQLTEI